MGHGRWPPSYKNTQHEHRSRLTAPQPQPSPAPYYYPRHTLSVKILLDTSHSACPDASLAIVMPRLFFAASDDNLRARAHHQDQHLGTKHNVWGRTWTKVGGWLKREEERRHGHGKTFDSNTKQNQDEAPQPPLQPAAEGRRFSRTVVPELPRLGTFKRQESEQRDHLYEHEPNAAERRAKSIERRASRMRLGRLSLPPMPRPAFSAPDMRSPEPA